MQKKIKHGTEAMNYVSKTTAILSYLGNLGLYVLHITNVQHGKQNSLPLPPSPILEIKNIKKNSYSYHQHPKLSTFKLLAYLHIFIFKYF